MSHAPPPPPLLLLLLQLRTSGRKGNSLKPTAQLPKSRPMLRRTMNLQRAL